MNFDNLPILIILVLSVIGNNQSVAIAAAALLFAKLIGLDAWFPFIEKNALQAGIVMLTLSILVPLVSGKITMSDMTGTFRTTTGLLGIGIGVFAAWMGGRGLILISAEPQVISSLVIGTIIGVCFFQGIAVGPLIAGGMLSLIVALSGLFR